MYLEHFNPENTIKKIQEKLSVIDKQDVLDRMYYFRNKNWTSQGLYAYLKYSTNSEEIFQDKLRKCITDEMIEGFYSEYLEMLADIAEDEKWFEKEILENEGLTPEDDDYLEVFYDYLDASEDLSPPVGLFSLVVFEMAEKLFDELKEEKYELLEEVHNLIEFKELDELFSTDISFCDDNLTFTINIYDDETNECFEFNTIDEVKNFLENNLAEQE
jgi:uncharacterized protein YfkK (UPF0435 family)